MFKLSDVYKIINGLSLEFGDMNVSNITIIGNNELRIEFKQDDSEDIKGIAVYK